MKRISPITKATMRRKIRGVQYKPLSPHTGMAEVFAVLENNQVVKLFVIDKYNDYCSPFKKHDLINKTVQQVTDFRNEYYKGKILYIW